MSIHHYYLQAISYLLMFIFIILIIPLHLFPCFIVGCLTYEVIVSLSPYFERLVGSNWARWVIIIFIAIFLMIIITIIIFYLIHFIISDMQHGINITDQTNRIFYEIKNHIQNCFPSLLPVSAEELQNKLFKFVESNLIVIHNISRGLLHNIITIFIGFIISIVITLNKPSNKNTYFVQQLLKRLHYFSTAFHHIVFAQIKVSLVNTLLTSIMILIILPLFNIYLPFSNILIAVTFIFGLLPIIGNLISNFMIVISALSISLTISGIMVLYLIFIHKLEYLLNAEIIGNSINAKSWELLIAMLIFEASFGLEGLVAAPVYYAYLKTELRACNII